MTQRRAATVLIATLAISSAWYVFKHVIQPNVEARRAFAEAVLSGRAEAPYQYRVLHPLLGSALESVLPAGLGVEWRHGVAYGALLLACFGGIFSLFHAWLSRLFSPGTALLGTLMLAVPLPLSVTGYFVEGDFLTLLSFVLGFWLMAAEHDAWLPLLVGLGTLNRAQAVYIVVFYATHLLATRALGDRSKRAILAASAIAFVAVFLGLRSFYRPLPSEYGIAFNVAHNTSLRGLREAILPLWLSVVAGTALLAALAFRSTTRFFRLAFLALGPYLLCFFLLGLLIELAKFLPAFLILIPMALQSLTGERPPEPPGS